ncbi:MAG: hypothetical protein KGM18_09195 [Sphingomonadales bacterium]|nr:hypothetical protein [Sphingomonadales bacterium]
MGGFDFVFSLFGLLLGLALAEGLSGLARALKARHRGWIGWPTALLGLFVSCDVVTFWMYAWSMHSLITVSWPLLFGGFVVTGIYYLAASLIFPDGSDSDFDAHFDRHYRLVVGGVLLCNVALVAYTDAVIGLGNPGSLRAVVLTWSFFPVTLLAILVPRRAVVLACLCWLIALYPLSVVWH